MPMALLLAGWLVVLLVVGVRRGRLSEVLDQLTGDSVDVVEIDPRLARRAFPTGRGRLLGRDRRVRLDPLGDDHEEVLAGARRERVSCPSRRLSRRISFRRRLTSAWTICILVLISDATSRIFAPHDTRSGVE
jgi:hypothetical protein